MMDAKQLSRIKVTGTYLLIIMLMSIIFSFTIYRISDRELSQQRRIQIPGNMRIIISTNEFEDLREAQLMEARSNLRQKLITFNIFTLLAGGILSYYLALRSLKPIEDALEKQDRFTSDASHEIRTPLTAMRSEIEVTLRDKKLDLPGAKDTLVSNLEEITRLEALTEGLLQLAKQENNSLEKQKTNLNNIFDQAIERTNSLAKQKSIKIKLDSPKNMNVYAEPTSLLQAIVILLDNAIKYSPSGADVAVTAKNERSTQEISVSDTGPGISTEDLQHVFDRFYRSDKSRTNDAQQNGYGLGLAIAKEIVDGHSGEISIKSQPKIGTTAKISLPKK